MKIYIGVDRLTVREPDAGQLAIINSYRTLLAIDAREESVHIVGDPTKLFHLLYALAAKYDVELV